MCVLELLARHFRLLTHLSLLGGCGPQLSDRPSGQAGRQAGRLAVRQRVLGGNLYPLSPLRSRRPAPMAELCQGPRPPGACAASTGRPPTGTVSSPRKVRVSLSGHTSLQGGFAACRAGARGLTAAPGPIHTLVLSLHYALCPAPRRSGDSPVTRPTHR